ncbi:hypothetical protein G6F68_013142 [Rhizopus microsporus]|nr:hypothetical protein G6F68_013142 [Rhizopus microsporus]
MEHCQDSPKVVLPPIRYYDPFDQPFTYSNSEFAVYKKFADDTHHFDSTTLVIHPLDSSSSKSLDSTDFTRPIHLFTENELVRRKRRSFHAFEQRNLTNNDQIDLGYHVPRVATAAPRFRRFTHTVTILIPLPIRISNNTLEKTKKKAARRSLDGLWMIELN